MAVRGVWFHGSNGARVISNTRDGMNAGSGMSGRSTGTQSAMTCVGAHVSINMHMRCHSLSVIAGPDSVGRRGWMSG